MSETPIQQIQALKATSLRERGFFAAFISVLFALAANGALYLIDQGISILRSVHDWRETALALGLLLAGFAVIVITGLLWIGALQSLRLAWKMEKEGQTVRGRVLKKTLRQNGSKKFYHLVYGSDNDLCFDESISESEYHRLNMGDAINLRVLPGHPDIARLEK
jgi:hypothetical protein